jgi:hypothetical protein
MDATQAVGFPSDCVDTAENNERHQVCIQIHMLLFELLYLKCLIA